MDTKITPEEAKEGESMKRITVTKVREWYRKAGLSPAYRRWITDDHRACPLTARYIAAHPRPYRGTTPAQSPTLFENLGGRVVNSAIREYGGYYIEGFVDGWDGATRLLLPMPIAEYDRGYEDGEAARIEITTP
jgi:hypothetical protein